MIMGALTELADRRNRIIGYYEAKKIYRRVAQRAAKLDKNERIKLMEKLLEDYQEETYYFDLEQNLKYFLGIEVKTYFLFYPYCFKNHPRSIEMVKKAAKGHGFILIERRSEDCDFFLFHPKEHGLGLEIRDPSNRSPEKMNKIFSEIPWDYMEKEGYPTIMFFW